MSERNKTCLWCGKEMKSGNAYGCDHEPSPGPSCYRNELNEDGITIDLQETYGEGVPFPPPKGWKPPFAKKTKKEKTSRYSIAVLRQTLARMKGDVEELAEELDDLLASLK